MTPVAGPVLARVRAFVCGSLALLPLLLSAVGVFAVASFRASHGTCEIGLRGALGASSGTLRAEVVRDAARLLGAGRMSPMRSPRP